MEWTDNYKDRPQSYVKHYFFENYLEKLAYRILWSGEKFVYVDCFSGPWMANDADYKDTSFSIAIHKLRKIRDTLKGHGKSADIRFLFIEADPEAYLRLQAYASKIADFKVETINNEFENCIDRITSFVQKDFAFLFVDPKGWKGAAPILLQPLLNLRGEILINFMYDFVNRFKTDTTPTTRASIDGLFAGVDWETEYEKYSRAGLQNEDAVLELYQGLIKKFSPPNSFVTSMQIKKATAERTHYYLVYKTNHWVGVTKFREAEKNTLPEQDKIRRQTIHWKKNKESEQENLLFDAPIIADKSKLEREREARLIQAREMLKNLLKSKARIPYPELAGTILLTPTVFEMDLKDWLSDMYKEDVIFIEGLRGNSKRPNEKSVIVLNKRL